MNNMYHGHVFLAYVIGIVPILIGIKMGVLVAIMLYAAYVIGLFMGYLLTN